MIRLNRLMISEKTKEKVRDVSCMVPSHGKRQFEWTIVLGQYHDEVRKLVSCVDDSASPVGQEAHI